MLEKYGKKLFILLGCDVVYFILWVIPAIRIPASSAIFTGLGLMTMTALSFVEVEDDSLSGGSGTHACGNHTPADVFQILNIMWIIDPFRMISYIIRKGFFRLKNILKFPAIVS